ncbi:hypothetical protein [Brucella pituitosa]|uniref:Uncharacterized protein n=1 Tax=Brucella pituitosa TaxID=571256 RepID=A0A643EUL0_9HYPH|nr:hypothetical protein [Brucella pituitosa]KAB0567651.1 hypothetical protein F7Q93_19775 [Brucella pituitosa]
MLIDRVFPADIPDADVRIAAGDIVEGDTVADVPWLADTRGMRRSTQIGRPIVFFATSAFGISKECPERRELSRMLLVSNAPYSRHCRTIHMHSKAVIPFFCC